MATRFAKAAATAATAAAAAGAVVVATATPSVHAESWWDKAKGAASGLRSVATGVDVEKPELLNNKPQTNNGTNNGAMNNGSGTINMNDPNTINAFKGLSEEAVKAIKEMQARDATAREVVAQATGKAAENVSWYHMVEMIVASGFIGAAGLGIVSMIVSFGNKLVPGASGGSTKP